MTTPNVPVKSTDYVAMLRVIKPNIMFAAYVIKFERNIKDPLKLAAFFADGSVHNFANERRLLFDMEKEGFINKVEVTNYCSGEIAFSLRQLCLNPVAVDKQRFIQDAKSVAANPDFEGVFVDWALIKKLFDAPVPLDNARAVGRHAIISEVIIKPNNDSLI